MMITWLPAVTTLLWAATILLLPGLLVGIAFRLNGLWLWSAAGPLSVSVIAVASLVLSLIGVPWALPGVAAVAIALAAIVWLLVRVWWKQPRLLPAQEASGRGFRWVTVAALLVGGALLVWRITQSIGEPENISQTFDNIFHLNAVQFILDTGDASPLRIGLMNSPQGNLGFYPSGWHALVSLVASVSGASIPLATTATIVVVAAVVWVAGAVLLARTTLGSRRAVTLVAGVLSAAFAAYPVLLMFYGVLYPLFLGLALVPVGLALVLVLTDLARFAPGQRSSTLWLLLAGTVPGIALAHPGALMGLLALTVPLVTVWAWCALRSGRHRMRTGIIFLGFVVGGIVALVAVRPPRAQATWQPTMSPLQAVGRFVTSTLTMPPTPWILALLVLIGVSVALVRRSRFDFALLGMYAMAGTLFVVVAGVSDWRIRFWTTGVWYQNIPRIEAITVLALLPLAVLGAVWIGDAVQWLLGKRRGTADTAVAPVKRLLRAGLASVVTALLLAGAVLSTQMTELVKRTAASYEFRDDAALISSDELELLSRIADEVPAEATIVTNGWTGAGLAYAFAGRWVTMPHVMVDFTEEALVLNDKLNTAYPGSKVCSAAAKERAEYVLDFGNREVHGGAHSFPGLTGLSSSPAVELVDEEGDAKLYRLVGCEPDGGTA